MRLGLNEKCIQSFGLEILKGRDHLEDLHVWEVNIKMNMG
jgi:hypothetical protein